MNWSQERANGSAGGAPLPPVQTREPHRVVSEGYRRVATIERDPAIPDGEAGATAGNREADGPMGDLPMNIAWTAHELRGPLLGIRAAIDHVVSVLGSGREAEVLMRTRRELDRLSELVGAILRLSTEGDATCLQNADLVEVVQEAVDSVSLETESEPAVVVSSGQVRADIDPPQLRTAVANLVRNAIAYSGKAEPVVVTVSRRGDSATIVVHDRGPGPDPSDRERIFEPFVRGPNAPGNPPGSGLGLYLTRRIVAAHGGFVNASTADGRSAFRVELPLGMDGRRASAS